MKRLFALAVGVFLSALLSAPVQGGTTSAAPSAVPKTQQGVKNSKKAIQKMQQRYQKMREVRKAAQAKRQQAMSRKNKGGAQPRL